MLAFVTGAIYFDKVYKKFYQVISITPDGVLITWPSKLYLDSSLKTTDKIRSDIDHVDNRVRIEVYELLRKLNNKRLLFIKDYKPLLDNSLIISPTKDYTVYGITRTPVSGDLVTTDKGATSNFIRKTYNAEIVHPTAFMMNRPFHNQLVQFIKDKSMDIKDYTVLIHRKI